MSSEFPAGMLIDDKNISELRERIAAAENGTALSHFPIRYDVCASLIAAAETFPVLWEVYHAVCHLTRDGEDTAGRRKWTADALAAFESAFPVLAHGVRFQTPVAEPPADAEMAQAERAVIEAAGALLPTKFGTLTERWRIGNVERAARALIEGRQRSAAAKEQG